MDALFGHVVKMQGPRPFGAVLDAGTGRSSLEFICGLPTSRWVAVTGDAGETDYLRAELGGVIRPQDRLVMGNWADDLLLRGEVFDVVLADYLLGAVERVAPYFQEELLRRLRPHVGGRFYAVGMEPLPLHSTEKPQQALLELFRISDLSRTLLGERSYREYPLSWVTRSLGRAGYGVVDASVFPVVYRMPKVQRTVDGARSRLARLTDAPLRLALLGALTRSLDVVAAALSGQDGVMLGQDWVVTAEPAQGSFTR